jgi:tetratricopeptide (TPR) repeat protein
MAEHLHQHSRHRRLTPVVCLLLVALCTIVFGQTLRHEFVNYDDPDYVYQNPKITQGLTLAGVAWAFGNVHARNWHPLTTISHMLDCQIFGLNAGGHHFTNLLLHSAAAVALFLVLRSMTGALWRCAFVAAVFAVHPLRAESVAWVAERKDVLSGLLFVLTLGAYLRYTRRRSAARYLLLIVIFSLGLLAKPMLVTVPFVLLLVDFWPLRRFREEGKALRLLTEKLPLITLAATAALVTFLIQKTGGALRESLPIAWRISNGIVASFAYIRDTFWPTKLAPFYPHLENRLPVWEITIAALALVAVTLLVCIRWKKNPYGVTGWFWYLGMLTPVIGIIEVGAHTRADRYTYLPQMGLLICLTWAVAELSANWRYRRQILGAAGGVVVLALTWSAALQAARWRDSETLWTHTLRVTSDNHVAHNNIADLLYQRGDVDKAFPHYQKALEIRSQSHIGNYDFLLALYHNNYANAVRWKGALDEAVTHYERAIEFQPDYYDAYLNYGGALLERGSHEAGIAILRKLLQMQPGMAAAHSDLGTALLQQGDEQEAIEHYETALAIDPRSDAPLNNLTWLFATSRDPLIRNPTRAVELAQQATRLLGGDDPMLLHKVAAAHAANGNFQEAIATGERALEIARREGNAGLTNELQQNIARYETGTPLTDVRRPELAPR